MHGDQVKVSPLEGFIVLLKDKVFVFATAAVVADQLVVVVLALKSDEVAPLNPI